MKFKKIKIFTCVLLIMAEFCCSIYAVSSKLERDAAKVYSALKIEAAEYAEHSGEHWFDRNVRIIQLSINAFRKYSKQGFPKIVDGSLFDICPGQVEYSGIRKSGYSHDFKFSLYPYINYGSLGMSLGTHFTSCYDVAVEHATHTDFELKKRVVDGVVMRLKIMPDAKIGKSDYIQNVCDKIKEQYFKYMDSKIMNILCENVGLVAAILDYDVLVWEGERPNFTTEVVIDKYDEYLTLNREKVIVCEPDIIPEV